jgi:uncharacterized protein
MVGDFFFAETQKIALAMMECAAVVHVLLFLLVAGSMHPSLADFTAVGGLIMLATDFRTCKIREFSVANMLPSPFIARPLSAFRARFFHL